MKISTTALIFAFVRSALAAPTLLSAESDQPSTGYPIGQSKGSNAKVAVEYFAGSNAWWLAHLSKNADVDKALKQVTATGYKILRVWGFGDVNTLPPATATDPNKVYFHIINSTESYINYGADGLQRLDYVVSSAEKYGAKLILPFLNNWGGFGGINAYSTAFGTNATTFYTDARAQKAYRSYVKNVVTRYKSSNAIFAWELANEPRCCKGCPSSVITKWATEISSYIKSLDPGHMVTLGDGGWLYPSAGTDGSYAYSGAEGVDFVANLKIKTLDYGTFHLYPNSWGYDYTWGPKWIAEHNAVRKASGKPIILEEYGTPFPGNHTPTEGPWQTSVLNSGIAADQIWQFGSNDLSIPGPTLGDVNTIYYGDREYKTLGKQHAKAMLAKRV